MSTVVIGVGNAYRSDDGVGPYVVDVLRELEVPGVSLEHSLGETGDLIERWTGRRLAIVVDAVRTRSTHPGRVHHLVVPDVENVIVHPAGLATLTPRAQESERIRAASSHGIDLGEAIELSRVLHRLPDRLELYAIEVDEVGLGPGLSEPVAAAARAVAEHIHAALTTATAAATAPVTVPVP
jgi:hydrogenase maturation protease